MSCPTCSGTMQSLGLNQLDRRTFWCPRCGTLRTEGGGINEAVPPSLVARCRAYSADVSMIEEWYSCGIAEAISTPENRN
jgi:Zn-finger nucleic acid-binding protein